MKSKTKPQRPREFLVDKYAPVSFSSGYVFQDKSTEMKITKWVESGEIPHLIFHGSPGSGKSTAAKCFINDLDIDPADVLRVPRVRKVSQVEEEIYSFTRRSPYGKFKLVIIEEADRMPFQAQKELLTILEDHSMSTRFILTCNHFSKLQEALVSRCQVLEMTEANIEGILDAVMRVIGGEGISFADDDDLIGHIEKYAPDLRKIINSIDECTDANKVLHPPSTKSSTLGIEELEEYFGSVTKVTLDGLKQLLDGVDSDNAEDYLTVMYQNSSKFPDESVAIIRIAEWSVNVVDMANKRLAIDACISSIFIEEE